MLLARCMKLSHCRAACVARTAFMLPWLKVPQVKAKPLTVCDHAALQLSVAASHLIMLMTANACAGQ